MIGKCTTKWLKKSKGCFPGNDKFEGKEDYCNQEILLWGTGMFLLIKQVLVYILLGIE